MLKDILSDGSQRQEGVGLIFDVKDYPIQGRLYLKDGDEIVMKALAELTPKGYFKYSINKLPTKMFKNIMFESEGVKTITIRADDAPQHFSWEFIPMNLTYDIVKGKDGYVTPDFSFSVIDINHYGTFTPLLCDKEFCTVERY